MTTYFAKRGRRYYPIAEHMTYDTLTKGTYLVTIEPGGYSWTRLVEPASGEVEAAIRIAQEAMVTAMREMNANCGEPMGMETKKEQELARKAWKAYCDVFGKERMVSYRGVSMHDVVNAGIKALREHINAQDDDEGSHRNPSSARKGNSAQEP